MRRKFLGGVSLTLGILLNFFNISASATTTANSGDKVATQVFNSTGVRLEAPTSTIASACVIVDGIRTDGSSGTPKATPYNGGNNFATVQSASTFFGRPLKQVVSTQPTQCVTACPTGQTWNGSTCSSTCTNSTETVTAVCSGNAAKSYQITKTYSADCTQSVSDNAATACSNLVCPTNSTAVSGACVCNTGYASNNGICTMTCENPLFSPQPGGTKVVNDICLPGQVGTATVTSRSYCVTSIYNFGLVWASAPADYSGCGYLVAASNITVTATGNNYVGVSANYISTHAVSKIDLTAEPGGTYQLEFIGVPAGVTIVSAKSVTTGTAAIGGYGITPKISGIGTRGSNHYVDFVVPARTVDQKPWTTTISITWNNPVAKFTPTFKLYRGTPR